VPKTISKRYEVGKLCRINRSGPVFLDTVYILIASYICVVTNVTTQCTNVIKLVHWLLRLVQQVLCSPV